MTDRERWIIYPLLFLALGASLRDKLIKSTESQRIKCQGLMVYDSTGQPLMVLGHEYFADQLPRNAENFINVSRIKTQKFSTESAQFGTGIAQNVMSRNYYLTDGKNSFRIDGQYTVPLWQWLTRNSPRATPPPPNQQGQAPARNSPVPPSRQRGTPEIPPSIVPPATTPPPESPSVESPPSEPEAAPERTE